MIEYLTNATNTQKGERYMTQNTELDQKLFELIKVKRNHNNISEVLNLMQQGANINAQDEDGYTLWHHAAMNNDDELAKFLANIGCQPGTDHKELKTPLYYAVYHDNLYIMKLLFRAGAYKNYDELIMLGRERGSLKCLEYIFSFWYHHNHQFLIDKLDKISDQLDNIFNWMAPEEERDLRKKKDTQYTLKQMRINIKDRNDK